ncbi:hypothetical protein OUZ56_010270 [Daphnia magna]|uniref:Uncharacterized protein n=1 Tax=Daphnia magna TaxID=35525 RepID=A0ABR0AI40_9CRUS|nr:hypothetical protein OUZ56_010270 [Daphnia magna]
MDGSNREFSAAVISLEDVTATEDERDELSVVEIPAIKESPEILNPSPNPETLTFVPSQQSNRERSHNSSEEQSQRDDDFVSLWVPAFLSCETLHDLDDVLERCIADWLPKAQILQEPCPEQPRGNPEKKKETKTGRCRRHGDISSKRRKRRGRFSGSSTFTQEKPFERCSKTIHPSTMELYKLRRNISRGLTTD